MENWTEIVFCCLKPHKRLAGIRTQINHGQGVTYGMFKAAHEELSSASCLCELGSTAGGHVLHIYSRGVSNLFRKMADVGVGTSHPALITVYCLLL